MTLRKGLTRLEGVADAKLIIKPPHMQVRMKPGFWPDLPRMVQTIRDAGYKPIEGGITLTVTGKVTKQGDQFLVELDGMQSTATLPLAVAKERANLAEHLARHAGEVVELEGGWQPPAEGTRTGSLMVTAVYGAEDRKPSK